MSGFIISNGMAQWMASRLVAEYYFPLPIIPMRQGGMKGSAGKRLNKTYQDAITEMVREHDLPKIPKGKRIGMVIEFLGNFSGDQSNCIKMIEDGMKRVAFHDDDAIDFHLVVRTPYHNSAIHVQLVERS